MEQQDARGNKKDAKAVKPRERLTIEVLESELTALGYSVSSNEITGESDVSCADGAERVATADALCTLAVSRLSGVYTGCTPQLVERYLSFIADKHPVNPVKNWLASLVWDGLDRYPDFFDLYGVADDELSRILLRKWRRQGVALQANSVDCPFGADGLLVLPGKQGLGKTSSLRAQACFPQRPGWFREGQTLREFDKDFQRRVLTCWICELGELEQTLKADPAMIRAFVTQSIDEYRLPYGRCDVKRPRRTNLAATCNDTRFLVDQTGNRRFWTVPIERKIPALELSAFNWEQLWAQDVAEVRTMRLQDSFRLTADEQEALAVRNGTHLRLVRGEAEVMDILDAGADGAGMRMAEVTLSQFKDAHDILRPYSVELIGRALRAQGIEPRQVRRDGERRRLYTLPMPQWYSGVSASQASHAVTG